MLWSYLVLWTERRVLASSPFKTLRQPSIEKKGMQLGTVVEEQTQLEDRGEPSTIGQARPAVRAANVGRLTIYSSSLSTLGSRCPSTTWSRSMQQQM